LNSKYDLKESTWSLIERLKVLIIKEAELSDESIDKII
jgi:hypothetical protein